LTITVFVVGIALCSILALLRMPVDIFPNLNLPVIFVAQPYGGMSPAQMEGYLVYYYEYHFLYITGIESVESKSIQSLGLVKLTFHPGTDMSQAAAQTVRSGSPACLPHGAGGSHSGAQYRERRRASRKCTDRGSVAVGPHQLCRLQHQGPANPAYPDWRRSHRVSA
jgi:hypothetical protein